MVQGPLEDGLSEWNSLGSHQNCTNCAHLQHMLINHACLHALNDALIGINFKKRELAEGKPMPPKREVASDGGPCHPALVPDGNLVAAQDAQLVELHKLPLVFDLDQGEQEVVDHFTSQVNR